MRGLAGPPGPRRCWCRSTSGAYAVPDAAAHPALAVPAGPEPPFQGPRRASGNTRSAPTRTPLPGSRHRSRWRRGRVCTTGTFGVARGRVGAPTSMTSPGSMTCSRTSTATAELNPSDRCRSVSRSEPHLTHRSHRRQPRRKSL